IKKDSAGKTLLFIGAVDSNTLITLLELRKYYKLIRTISAEPSTVYNRKVIKLGDELTKYVNSQCSSLSLQVDSPVGVIAVGAATLLKGLDFVKKYGWLVFIPLSISADFKQFAGVELKVDYENLGALRGNGYNVVEYVDLYAISGQVKISDGCVVDLPVGYIISR
ncbi:MAG: hypothetical protein QW686_08385, partial [Pyrobaculum sp.]